MGWDFGFPLEIIFLLFMQHMKHLGTDFVLLYVYYGSVFRCSIHLSGFRTEKSGKDVLHKPQ